MCRPDVLSFKSSHLGSSLIMWHVIWHSQRTALLFSVYQTTSFIYSMLFHPYYCVNCHRVMRLQLSSHNRSHSFTVVLEFLQGRNFGWSDTLSSWWCFQFFLVFFLPKRPISILSTKHCSISILEYADGVLRQAASSISLVLMNWFLYSTSFLL